MATSTTKNKKMIIKGAGKFMAKIPGCDELITLGTMNNMRLDIQLDMQDVEGGDTSVPLDTLLRKKTIDITAEDAKFDLNMVRLVLGSKMREGVSGAPYKMVSETQTVVDNSGTLEVALTQQSIASPAPTVRKGNAAGPLVDVTHNVGANKLTINSGAAAGDTVFVTYAVAATPDKDGYVWVLEEKHTVKNGKITLGFGSTLYEEDGSKTKHISVRALKDNKRLKQVANSPAEFEYTVDGDTGEITFNSAMENIDVYVNYKRNEVVDVLDISTRDFPLTVSVVHDGLFEQKDGSLQGYQIELYACRVKSNFTLDAARQQASTHSVTLTVIDPERVDNKLGTIKRYEVVNPNTVDVC
jgi:hypothetical protein